MPRPTTEQHLLLEQVQHIARGLGETLAPFCEVVVHDLLHPEHAILAIHNNQSGREVGAPATELGLARIADPEFPQVLANYANRYADSGRLFRLLSCSGYWRKCAVQLSNGYRKNRDQSRSGK